MVRSVKKYLKISKGQISKNLVERTDIGILDDSGQEITNFYNTKYGALQTVAGTEFMFNFGKDAKVKLHTIHLSDNKEATLAFDATNQKLYLFDYQGNQLDQISFPYITEENYERSNIAQQEELVLLATGDNPLVQIGITNNKLSHSIYTIPAKNVMKVKNVVKPMADVSVYRTKETINSQEQANQILPTLDTGWKVGTYVQPNQTEDKPSETFPWSVYQKTDDGWVGPMDFYPNGAQIYDNNTAGSYNFTVPSGVEAIEIEFAGAAGQQVQAYGGSNPADIQWHGTPGRGSRKSIIIIAENISVAMNIGAQPKKAKDTSRIGGVGYNNGGNGATFNTTFGNGLTIHSGGGGGSTSISVLGKIYTAGGGSGVGYGRNENDAYWDISLAGGSGGGPNGGAKTSAPLPDSIEKWYNGHDATDPDATSYNSGTGYVKIYAHYVSATITISKNVWDGTEYEYSRSWVAFKALEDLEYPSSKFAVSATAGIVNITPVSGNLVSITAPTGLDPLKYAQSRIIGTNFDSDSAIGVVRITEFTGSASEQTYNITKISGPTIVGFDKVYTKDDPATGFKITTSMTPALSGALPSTNDNPTSDTNYPNLITFYQQRLVIFGTQYNQEQILFSNIGEYDNFTDDYLSTSAFQLVIGSDQKESIRAFCLNQGIQIFTNVSEWLMDAQTITRTTGFVRNSQIGTNGVKPIISANGTTLFCPKNGKGIIGFIYNEKSASYMTPYISMFTDLLDVEIRDLFLKRGRDSQDDTLLYICDANGNLIIGNYLQDHNIQGFCRRSATGVKFLQSVQNEENVLLLSSRAGYTTLERIDQSKNTAHSTRLFQYNQESGVITLELPQYQNTLLNVYDEIGEFVDAYKASRDKEQYEWTYDRMVCRTDAQLAIGNLIYFDSRIVGKVDFYFPGQDNIEWHRFGYCWEHEEKRFYTTTDTPVVGDIATSTTSFTGEITEVGLDYIKVSHFDTEYICYRNVSRDGPTNVFTVNQKISDMKIVTVSTIEIPEGKRPQAISEIGYNIHQVFHSNPMNIGGITMSEYKSIARIDLALTSESRHDALTINKKYGRRKGNLVSYVRPQRPTRDCTFTIENDIYPVEILSMEVEIEY